MAATTVYLKHVGEEPIRAALTGTGAKVELKPGEVRLAELKTAENLERMYPVRFKVLSPTEVSTKDAKFAKEMLEKESPVVKEEAEEISPTPVPEEEKEEAPKTAKK